MSQRQIRNCDSFVYIAQFGKGTASLNVAVAGSIVMHRYGVWWERRREQQLEEKRPQVEVEEGCGERRG